MAKQYKTWEVIKELSENNTFKFKLVYGAKRPDLLGIVARDCNGCFRVEGDTNSIDLDSISSLFMNAIWAKVQQPVTFLEAILEAINSGKRIKPWGVFDFADWRYWLNRFSNNNNISKKLKLIKGKWLIEDGE